MEGLSSPRGASGEPRRRLGTPFWRPGDSLKAPEATQRLLGGLIFIAIYSVFCRSLFFSSFVTFLCFTSLEFLKKIVIFLLLLFWCSFFINFDRFSKSSVSLTREPHFRASGLAQGSSLGAQEASRSPLGAPWSRPGLPCASPEAPLRPPNTCYLKCFLQVALFQVFLYLLQCQFGVFFVKCK